MPRLSNQQRSEAVGMLRANATVAHVANHFGVSRVWMNKLRHVYRQHAVSTTGLGQADHVLRHMIDIE